MRIKQGKNDACQFLNSCFRPQIDGGATAPAQNRRLVIDVMILQFASSEIMSMPQRVMS
jgi:hypothetical protein